MSHPPSADKVVAIDFDATIAPWGPLFDLGAPFPGVMEALRRLYRAGYGIVILTSRLSPQWWDTDYERFGYDDPVAFGAANQRYVELYLARYGIIYGDLTCEKVPAEAYFDDRGIGVVPGHLGQAIDDYLWIRQ